MYRGVPCLRPGLGEDGMTSHRIRSHHVRPEAHPSASGKSPSLSCFQARVTSCLPDTLRDSLGHSRLHRWAFSSPHLTELPEGTPPWTPGLQERVVNDLPATEAPGYLPDGACHEGLPSTDGPLHGMIWMTLAFFMFAGRLPVLMFSFMMRTFVSFCSQERHSRAVKTLMFPRDCSAF